MARQVWHGLAFIVCLALAQQAVAASYQYINLPAAAFAGHDTSDHNDGLAPDACTAMVPLGTGYESRGGLVNAKGSFIAAAQLPQGARVAAFTLFASDADDEANSIAYLVRRRLAHGLSAANAPDGVIATAATAGAAPDTMRAFPGKIVNAAVIDNSQFQYFVELVNCSPKIEPFTAQIVTVQQ